MTSNIFLKLIRKKIETTKHRLRLLCNSSTKFRSKLRQFFGSGNFDFAICSAGRIQISKYHQTKPNSNRCVTIPLDIQGHLLRFNIWTSKTYHPKSNFLGRYSPGCLGSGFSHPKPAPSIASGRPEMHVAQPQPHWVAMVGSTGQKYTPLFYQVF